MRQAWHSERDMSLQPHSVTVQSMFVCVTLCVCMYVRWSENVGYVIITCVYGVCGVCAHMVGGVCVVVCASV